MNIGYEMGKIMDDGRYKALILLGLILLSAGVVYAQQAATAVEMAITCIACRIMQIIFMIIGMVVTLVIIFAGLKWIGSGDDPDSRNSAKSMIIHAIIGFIIVILAAYLVSWITSGLLDFNIADPINAVKGCTQWCVATP